MLLFVVKAAKSVFVVPDVAPGTRPLTQLFGLAQFWSCATAAQVGAGLTMRSISVPPPGTPAPGLLNFSWKPGMPTPMLKDVGVKFVVPDSVMIL
jgi:hypothetical protein